MSNRLKSPAQRFGGRTASIIKCLQRLRSEGFKFALDDVGTGNARLDMLRHVKVDSQQAPRASHIRHWRL